MKLFLILIALMIAMPVYGAENTFYTLDFDAEASSNEHPTEQCLRKIGNSRKSLGTDCEINTEGADEIFVCYDTNLDVLGTHGATDWEMKFRPVAVPDGTYPTAGAVGGGSGTNPTVNWHEWTGLADTDIDCIGLTTGPYALKIRVRTPSATIAAPTITVRVTKKPN